MEISSRNVSWLQNARSNLNAKSSIPVRKRFERRRFEEQGPIDPPMFSGVDGPSRKMHFKPISQIELKNRRMHAAIRPYSHRVMDVALAIKKFNENPPVSVKKLH